MTDTDLETSDNQQGVLLGPDLYSDFTRPHGDLIKHYDIILSFYADHSQKSSNQLKLNEGKTKVMIFGKPSDLKKLNITSICIRDSRIIPSLVATNIGVDRHSGLKLE